MDVNNLPPEYERIANILKDKLQQKDSCLGVVDAYATLLASIWSFTARLVGEAGSKAVVTRAIKVAAREAPLVQVLQVKDDGVDFSVLRSQLQTEACKPAEVIDALLHLGIAVFQTLSELTGEALTEPLLRHLEEEK